MICKNCGASLPDGTLVCQSCGQHTDSGRKAAGHRSFSKTDKTFAIIIALILVVGLVTGGLFHSRLGGRSSDDGYGGDEQYAPYPEYDTVPFDPDADGQTVSPDGDTADVNTSSPAGYDSAAPFYGIWCAAYVSAGDAESLVQNMQGQGLCGEVIVTSEWENLNPTTYYVVTAGRYYSESEAESALYAVAAYYPDAYIKYTGAKLVP